jgi:hypothetical protein
MLASLATYTCKIGAQNSPFRAQERKLPGVGATAPYGLMYGLATTAPTTLTSSDSVA